MAKDTFNPDNLPSNKEKFMTELEVRELIAAALANYTGVVRFRNVTTTDVNIGDFTNAQHTHTNAAGGGQLTDAALSSVVTVPKGGTGVNTIASGEFVLGAGAGAVTTLATVTVAKGGTGATTLTGILKGNGTSAVSVITPLAGTKTCYVATSSGGAVTTQITFTDGVLTGGL